MTYIWIPVRTIHVPTLAAGVFDLHRPPGVRAENEVTVYYGCGWIDHPTSGFSAWKIPAEETITMHHDPDGSRLAQVLTTFVQDGSITVQELQGIVGAVQTMQGQSVAVIAMIPPSWQPYVMHSEAELIAAGFMEAEV